MIEVPSKRLPKALQKKPMVRAKAVSIYKVDQADTNEDQVYIGTLIASDPFKRTLGTNRSYRFFSELTEVYRDIYGDCPWNEFLSCSKKSCSGKRGISDIYGLSSENRTKLTELEKKRKIIPRDYGCPLCGSPMNFYYSREDLLSMIKREFNQEFVAVLILDHEGNVLGFSWAWFADADAVSQKLLTQFRCAPDSPILMTTKDYIRENRLRQVLLWNEWAVYQPYRNTIYSLLLIVFVSLLGKERAALLGDNDPFFIGTTLEGSNAYNGHRRFGAETVYRDPTTNVVVMSNPVQRGLDQYARVERVLTKRLRRANRHKSVGPVQERPDTAVALERRTG